MKLPVKFKRQKDNIAVNVNGVDIVAINFLSIDADENKLLTNLTIISPNALPLVIIAAVNRAVDCLQEDGACTVTKGERFKKTMKKVYRRIKKTIYFDADGILVDWVKDVLEKLAHIPYLPTPLTQEELNKMPNRHNVIKAMYTEYPSTFAELEPVTNGILLFSLVNGLRLKGYDFNLRVLTAVGEDHPSPEDATSDKKWLLSRLTGLGESEIVVVHRSADKEEYLAADCLLVDDWDKNIITAEKCGATGVHIPDMESLTINDIHTHLDTIKEFVS